MKRPNFQIHELKKPIFNLQNEPYVYKFRNRKTERKKKKKRGYLGDGTDARLGKGGEAERLVNWPKEGTCFGGADGPDAFPNPAPELLLDAIISFFFVYSISYDITSVSLSDGNTASSIESEKGEREGTDCGSEVSAPDTVFKL